MGEAGEDVFGLGVMRVEVGKEEVGEEALG